MLSGNQAGEQWREEKEGYKPRDKLFENLKDGDKESFIQWHRHFLSKAPIT